ncbi:hypothetical protein [Psychrilyobacter sp.]|uniref:hypothetical protein n=1 Tax=Psychrilyobacter sp. TaxID=2586924 RepID=UPI003018F37D
MLNRVLILLESESDIDNLLRSGQYFKEKYGAEIYGLHIKDMKKYDPSSKAVEGIGVGNSANFFIREWKKLENEETEDIKIIFKNYFPLDNLLIENGIPNDIILEKMLGFDLIISEINKYISSIQKGLLKHHYKPVLLIPKNTILNIEKIMIANNNSEKVNRSIFNFLNMFNQLNKFTSVAVNLNYGTNNEFFNYMKVAKKTLTSLELEGKALNIICEKSKEFDILIIGDLKHSFLIENLVGSTGLKLLKKINIPIYIG